MLRLDFLRTSCHGLDRMLGGGLPPQQVTLLYGEAATGKSILATQCALNAAREKSKIFYVDSDQSFSANRVEQMTAALDWAESIVLFLPGDLEEQSKIVENIENMLSNTPTLLVVDSITGLLRTGQGDSEGYFSRDRELNRQMARVHGLASRFSMWVLLLGQVHSSPSGGEWLVEPVATRTLKHWSDVILKVRKTARADVRDCLLEKKNGSEVTGVHCPFRITGSGIEDVLD